MRFLILSDLHLERGWTYEPPDDVDYDAVILAGDIHTPGREAVSWAKHQGPFEGRPVVIVPGNHEFYGTELASEVASMRAEAAGSPVHVLSGDSVVLGDVRVLGATLWTDFALPIRSAGDVGGRGETDIRRALALANQAKADFYSIEVASQILPQDTSWTLQRPLRAEDTLVMHWEQRNWLARQIKLAARPAETWRATVVVTHHAPSGRSVQPHHRHNWLTPAFASNLPRSMFGSGSTAGAH
ncbi:MAG: metallophosphoesterase, partial [Paucibacter sp.]|nr:metallophosphoesterase [Roseateles sp.]